MFNLVSNLIYGSSITESPSPIPTPRKSKITIDNDPRLHGQDKVHSRGRNIQLPKLPTNVFVDYDPQSPNDNLMFPMDDLGNPPVTFVEATPCNSQSTKELVSQSAEVSRAGITSLFQDSERLEDFDAIPSQELVDLSARIRVENSLDSLDRSRSPSPVEHHSPKIGPLGTIEARIKLETLKTKYLDATKIRMRKFGMN
jgi:hypothetical protein